MVQNSGPLVDGVVSALDACDTGDRAAFNSGMEKVVASMTKVNKVMDGKFIPLSSFDPRLWGWFEDA